MAIPTNMASLQTLLKMKSPSNFSPEGADPYVLKRQAQIAGGDDALAPSELEQMQTQAGLGDRGLGVSRDMIRDSGINSLKQKLGIMNATEEAKGRAAIAPEIVKGQFGLQERQLQNEGELAKGEATNQTARDVAGITGKSRTDAAGIAAGAKAGGGAGASEYAGERTRRAIDAAKKLLPNINHLTTGPIGYASHAIPGTPAYALATDLTFLKTNIIAKELAEMRAASKTGGALGQVSDYEDKLLSNAQANIDQFNNPDKVRQGVNDALESLSRWHAAKEKYGAGEVDATAGADPADAGDPYGLFGGQ